MEATVTGAQTAEITLTSTETKDIGLYRTEWEQRESDDTDPRTIQQFDLVIKQDARQ